MLRQAGLFYGLPIALALGLGLSVSTVQAETSAAKSASADANAMPADPEQALEQAVAVARAGDNKRGLRLLDVLIKAHPDFYPARRDFIVVAAWDNQCELAWQRFKALKSQAQYEDYLVQPLSECLRDMRRVEEAKALLKKAAEKNPDSEDIKFARQDLQQAMYWRNRPELSVNVGSSESDQGAREWHVQTRYSHPLSQATRVYARYLIKRATDPQFDTGNMYRAGIGVRTWLSDDDLLDVEGSTDVKRGEEQGGRLDYTHLLGRRWEFGATYSSYYEDVSLRAKAQGISANNAGLNTAFHTLDYRYEWSASVSRSHFSDTNKRNSASTGGSYAFELKPEREMRVLLDLYQADNSLADVVYYNPEHDFTATLSLRTDWVLDTKYERHVQHVTVYVADHEQRHYDSLTNYGAGYGFELQISKKSAVNLQAGYGRASYDGNYEDEGSVELTYTRKF